MSGMDNSFTNKNKKKLQTLQNKFLKISLMVPWFMRNKQLHNDTGLLYLSAWITQQFKISTKNFTKPTEHSIIKLAKDPST
jgi:hypothetical protein